MPEEIMKLLGIVDRRTLAIEPVKENLLHITASTEGFFKYLSIKATYRFVFEKV